MLWRLLCLGVFEWLGVTDIRWLNFSGAWDWDGDSMYGSPTPTKGSGEKRGIYIYIYISSIKSIYFSFSEADESYVVCESENYYHASGCVVGQLVTYVLWEAFSVYVHLTLYYSKVQNKYKVKH